MGRRRLDFKSAFIMRITPGKNANDFCSNLFAKEKNKQK